MSSGTHILVPTTDVPKKVSGYVVQSPAFDLEGWSELIPITSSEYNFKALSKTIGTLVVSFQISTSVDQVWITCFKQGRIIRELLYSSDSGWSITRGNPLPFENVERTKRWLRVPRLLASRDGYDLLADVLGVPSAEAEQLSEAGGRIRRVTPSAAELAMMDKYFGPPRVGESRAKKKKPSPQTKRRVSKSSAQKVKRTGRPKKR